MEAEVEGKGASTDVGASDVVRSESQDGGIISVYFKAEAESPCRGHHIEGICKIHLPAWPKGQHKSIFESIFGAKKTQKANREGHRRLRDLRGKKRGSGHHGTEVPG